ncbi:impB/mucB/samB family protein [Plectosphaerella plurivora]|uniref:DNA polymerase eta n=1 Tax=Plectosphaerella plurivora TaxID=936078 RepID=A0A9P8VEW3_9PEZI|nr:impB/mucB/samB family protein [Plectosphaerella plurivora]
MSSSPHFRESSPIHGYETRKSRFTYRQLSLLASYSTTTPLRVIAHIDLDAFYAQCEMVRLGIPKDQPLAVQQWQGLIAVNYAARAAGIGRHCTLDDARKLCPELIAQHVATWREGDDKWAYRDDAAANIVSDKVSLDPYRLQSRRILDVIKEALPANLQKVEKASIDEVFCDLSAQVHSIMLERFPELSNPPPYDDPTERLPRPATTALDWQADALIDLDEEGEATDPDWDDIAILIGSEIIRHVRAQVLEKLEYTCSAGVACNKMLSKLGSAHKKPNQQTVIRNRAVEHFLSDFKFTKIRNLGGKLGENIASTFKTETIRELLLVPVDQMKSKLGDDTGIWVYKTIRGIDASEVNSRTQIKSMLSAKSFRPTIDTPEQANKWLRIFAADIFSRLVEEGVLENKRRPKTINLHHRHAGQVKSRSAPIPLGRAIDETSLFELARTLLGQIILEGRVWPCANLSLSVGGFEEGVTGNMGIGAFLVKGEAARALRQQDAEDAARPGAPEDRRPKRQRTDGGGGIERFLMRHASSDDTPSSPDRGLAGEDSAKGAAGPAADEHAPDAPIPSFTCSRCNGGFTDPEDLQSHQDWHMAKDLQEEDRRLQASSVPDRPSATRKSGDARGSSASASKRGGRGGGKLEQGQSKLRFG